MSSSSLVKASTVSTSSKLDSFKTSSLCTRINKISKGKSLFVRESKVADNFSLAAANLPNLNVISKEGLNVYDILCHDNLILTKNAFIYIEHKLIKNG